LTDVVLKKSSSLVLTDGVKPRGVCACAIAQLTKAATTKGEVIYMMMALTDEAMNIVKVECK
jgi:hypothetical protein